MTDSPSLEGLTVDELLELETLLRLLEAAAENPPQLPAPQSAAPAVASKPQPAENEPKRDFVNELCGPGSDKPSGKKIAGKYGYMA